MRKYILISILAVAAMGATAQQMSTGSSGDYKHPQLAQKAKQAEAEQQAKDKSTHELVYEKSPSYKNQHNNVPKVKGRRKKDNSSAPTNTDPNRRNADYKHGNGLW